MEKKLYRSTQRRLLAGVCGGIGAYLNVDPTVVRVIWAVAGIVSFGAAILAYIACALLIPEEPVNY